MKNLSDYVSHNCTNQKQETLMGPERLQPTMTLPDWFMVKKNLKELTEYEDTPLIDNFKMDNVI